MSISTLALKPAVAAKAASTGFQEKIVRKIDAGLVRFDAWFVVLIAVILALGATLLLGMAAWCLTKGKKFTGSWGYDGLFHVEVECK